MEVERASHDLRGVCSREAFRRVHPTGKVHVVPVEIRGRRTSLPVSVLLDGGEGDDDAEGHLVRFALDDDADWGAIIALNIAASPAILAQNALVRVYLSGRAPSRGSTPRRRRARQGRTASTRAPRGPRRRRARACSERESWARPRCSTRESRANPLCRRRARNGSGGPRRLRRPRRRPAGLRRAERSRAREFRRGRREPCPSGGRTRSLSLIHI